MDLQARESAGAPPGGSQPTLFEGLAAPGREAPPPVGWRADVHPSWLPALEPVAMELDAVLARVRVDEEGGASVMPAPHHRLRALALPLEDVRVLVVGQDPYPTPGHAVGWAFSAPRDATPLPASLRNLLRELADDTGVGATSADLSPWVGRGVMLLNRVLTVRAGESASHRRLGWQGVTDAVVDALVERGGPLVSVLWGREAQSLAPRLAGTAVVTGVHPSPLSASRGFFGSRPFSAVDAALRAQGEEAMDWRLEDAESAARSTATTHATTGHRAPERTGGRS